MLEHQAAIPYSTIFKDVMICSPAVIRKSKTLGLDDKCLEEFHRNLTMVRLVMVNVNWRKLDWCSVGVGNVVRFERYWCLSVVWNFF